MEKLTRQRGGIKATLTNFDKYIANIQIKDRLSDVEIIELQGRINSIEGNIYQKFSDVQDQIEATCDETDLEREYNERDRFENNYYSLVAAAKKLLKENEPAETYDQSSDGAPSLRNSSASNQVSNHFNPLQGVKLPTINLPTFDGNLQNWLEFRDIYESLIHRNDSISDIQKFHYLRASLSHEPAQLIKGIEFSAINYELAWDLLVQRYNNDKMLIQNHIKNIFNLEPMPKESAKNIRNVLDCLTKNMRALSQLQLPVQHWDVPIVYLISTKLDSVTAREWETFKSKHENVASLEDLKKFLTSRTEILETLEQSRLDKGYDKRTVNKRSETRGFVVTGGGEKIPACSFCSGSHFIHACSEFLKIPLSDRGNAIKSKRLCLNCLKAGHFSKMCRRSTCKKCHSKHHTLLHVDNKRALGETKDDQHNDNESNNDDKNNEVSSVNTAHTDSSDVLLSTACIDVLDNYGKKHTIRILLDNGSQSCFVTDNLCNLLGISKKSTNLQVNGIGNIHANVVYKCNIDVHSRYNSSSYSVPCFVVAKITSVLPKYKLNISHLNIPKHIKLADPRFNEPQNIDMLIGADLFWDVICRGQIILGRNCPILQNTKFGWIVSGPLGNVEKNEIYCNLSRIDQSVDDENIQVTLKRFWEIEECLSERPRLSEEELACEEHFVKNTRRCENGAFIVKLPLKLEVSKLGDSYQQAERRFFNLENRLNKNPEYKELYCKFMREYIDLGHMTKVTNQKNLNCEYYMCHHGVVREDSLSTALRVVFDASAPSSTGYSLNNLQMVGATLQEDLFSILVRFRKHNFVVAADVAKMYRCVLVSEEDRHLQRIVWRFSPNDPLDVYELNTVTYGTAAASFLAIRCLYQLAYECEKDYPDISEMIKSDFYVDDLLTGASTIEEAIRVSQQVFNVLSKGCFVLRKFYSNKQEILDWIVDNNNLSKIVEFGERNAAKTLGLTWCPSLDYLTYEVKNIPEDTKVTKRTILSNSSKIFDPLGLVSPCIIQVKILLQALWLEKVSWDDPLPSHITAKWNEFKAEIKFLNTLRINRHVFGKTVVHYELHIFCDASEKAYGACVYGKSTDSEGNHVVNLLVAKGKVAPLKTITLPRLELCGALLAARLANNASKALKLNNVKRFFWSDSTIVLAWLKTPPNKLKTFVSNRISEIQETTSLDSWKHVPSASNPADLISRGMKPSDIEFAKIWWHGPEFLKQSEVDWPTNPCQVVNDLPDVKRNCSIFLASKVERFSLFDKYSDLPKLERVTALLLRFIQNCRQTKENRLFGPLTVGEIKFASERLIKIVQHSSFSTEIEHIKNNRLSSKNKLANLNPFLDPNEFLRVGGRLCNAKYAFEKKHPLILPNDHPFTKLLVRHYHWKLLHAGPQHMLASLRENYWIIAGRNLVKHVVRSCILCFRYSPKIVSPIMGNLPAERLNPTRPFDVVGVDYSGSFLIKNKLGRGAKLIKCYVSLFVCFLTKAVHLELVSDLTKESFILALRRFVSRRGKPRCIYSDNGTNFVSASNELMDLGNFIIQNQDDLAAALSKENIEWKFIPPRSPHFGGLWEAGIKSMKFHLKRVAGNVHFTYEFFYTLLTEIEAILNSRPISPLSSNPHDLSPLTPAHFLLGQESSCLPEVDLRATPVNRLTVYRHLQQIKQHIWQRWCKEYVSEMQQRTKWKKTQGSLQEGALVLIKEDNVPPMNWKLGRVVNLHQGKDGVSRVATLNTQGGTVKRSLAKLCPLPVDLDSKTVCD